MKEKRILQNTKWIVGCKIIQSILQMIIGMVSARYLGPANYGLINYAASIVAFVVPVMQLGMPSILVQEYVGKPEQEGKIFGTSLVMSLISSIACIIGVISFTMIVNHGEPVTIVVCALYSISILFQTADLMRYWFQSKLLSKYSSLAILLSYTVVSVYKIVLLIMQKNVYWFSVSHALEYLVIAIVLLIIYKKIGVHRIQFSFDLAKKMFAKSKYYIVANMMVMVYQNTDHIMLKLMIGEAENGFYTAAITAVGITGFVFFAITDSVRPVVLDASQKSRVDFEMIVAKVYSFITYLSLAQSICFSVFAKPIILILYGESYLEAIPILQILTWYTSFSYMGVIRNIWILAEEKHSILWIINLCGALMNIVLNYFMIPVWGAAGAAFASVLTQFFTNVVMGFILKPIRANNRLLLKGLNPKLLMEILAELRNKQEDLTP